MNFDQLWTDFLRNGFLPNTQFPTADLKFSSDSPTALAKEFRAPSGGLELVFLQSSSVDDGRYMEGFTAVAAPVLDSAGCMTHGIVVLGARERVKRLGVRAVGEELRRVALSFSADPQQPDKAPPPAKAARRAQARPTRSLNAGKAR